MELRNRSTQPAGFFNCVVSEDEFLASVVSRQTYHWEKGDLLQDGVDPVPVSAEPVKLSQCELDGESLYLRSGTDLIIVGTIHAPGGKPTTRLDLEIRAGQKFHRRILVVGDRVWEKRLLKVEPGEAEPFFEMPLSYQRAYGGVSLGEAGEMAFSANPAGRGFYLTADQAIGQPLANLEDPENPVRSWKDQPNPVGTEPYSRTWALRALNGIEIEEGPDRPRIKRIKPELFNNAHPSLIIPDPLHPGDEISVTHLTPEGALRFTVPDLSMHVHVQLEDRHFLFPLHLESIGILGDERRVFFTSRVAFKYQLIPLERRAVSLRTGPPPPALPDDYVIDWEKEET